ncbi:MAG: hypothetical protein ACI9K3_001051, partial [Halovenus sp.]
MVDGHDRGSIGSPPESETMSTVDLVLDWTPNTNHTGIYRESRQSASGSAKSEISVMNGGHRP